MSWADDALWLGPVITTRLKAELPELRGCYTVDDIDLTAKEPPQVPSALVMLSDLRPLEASPQQRVAMVEQDWLVMLAVRSAVRDPDRARQKLGTLVTKTITALQGWTPPGSQRAFAWRRGPRPEYTPGINFFPLLFTCPMVTK